MSSTSSSTVLRFIVFPMCKPADSTCAYQRRPVLSRSCVTTRPQTFSPDSDQARVWLCSPTIWEPYKQSIHHTVWHVKRPPPVSAPPRPALHCIAPAPDASSVQAKSAVPTPSKQGVSIPPAP